MRPDHIPLAGTNMTVVCNDLRKARFAFSYCTAGVDMIFILCWTRRQQLNCQPIILRIASCFKGLLFAASPNTVPRFCSAIIVKSQP